MRKLLSLDFDGVLHSYRSGWRGADRIDDAPVPGAMMFLRDAVDHFQVAVFSSRSHQPGGIAAMTEWLLRHLTYEFGAGIARSIVDAIEFPDHKPAAHVSIDDRAIQFNGSFPGLDELARFQPWNRREPQA